MKPNTTGWYRVHEFAEMAGVTVRTLHHYDHLGLLKPHRRTESGYRLYSDRDLARLEQIVVLKFLGLPLSQIGDLLQNGAALPDALRRQQRVLAEKRRQLDRAIVAIEKAARSLRTRRGPDWRLFNKSLRRSKCKTTAIGRRSITARRPRPELRHGNLCGLRNYKNG